MLFEIIFFSGFLYTSADTIIQLCSNDCTTERVLGFDLDNFEFQGKYCSFSKYHPNIAAACEGHLVQLEFLPDKEVGPILCKNLFLNRRHYRLRSRF